MACSGCLQQRMSCIRIPSPAINVFYRNDLSLFFFFSPSFSEAAQAGLCERQTCRAGVRGPLGLPCLAEVLSEPALTARCSPAGWQRKLRSFHLRFWNLCRKKKDACVWGVFASLHLLVVLLLLPACGDSWLLVLYFCSVKRPCFHL